MKYSSNTVLKKLIFNFYFAMSLFTGSIHAAETWEMGGGFLTEPTTGVFGIGGYTFSSNNVYNAGEDYPEYINNFHPVPLVTSKIVNTVHCLTMYKTGTYSDGKLILTIDIRDFSGTIKHTASVIGVDLQTAPTKTFIPIKLSKNLSNRTVLPGQYLAVHVSRIGPRGGDLELNLACQASVQ